MAKGVPWTPPRRQIVSKRLHQALSRALSPDPDKRWRSLRELLDVLEGIVAKARAATQARTPRDSDEIETHAVPALPDSVDGVRATTPAVATARRVRLAAVVLSVAIVAAIVLMATEAWTGAQ